MRRLPLTDQLPYRFRRPRIVPFWSWVGRLCNRRLLRVGQRVEGLTVEGGDRLRDRLGRGDGILVAPNHSDHADPASMYELGVRLGTPFYYMAAYQLFNGFNGWFLERIGAFPVDREGSDLSAFKAGVEILAAGRHPLVVFPEGEIYYQADRLTPIREGAAVLAATAVRKVPEGRNVWIVPVGIKYRFVEGHDPRPALERAMGDLEARLTWQPRPDLPIVERIYRYAEALMGLKEFEILGEHRTGPLPGRLAALTATILDRVGDRRGVTRHGEIAPVRIKELRKACLDALADPTTTPGQADAIRRDLGELFIAVQLFSYPGNYVRQDPTLERVAETLTKYEEDLLGTDVPRPKGPRRAIIKVGEPIDVRARVASAGKARLALGALTAELEAAIQERLDAIGPGRPLDPAPRPVQPPTEASSSGV